MTIQRTRELLGDEVKDLTDEQITQLIQSTGAFCEELLKVIVTDLLQAQKESDKNNTK